MMDRRERLIARARQGFRLAYGTEPARFAAAPGRVNLIGDHVDASGGYTLTCAIDREAIVAFGPADPNAKHPMIEAAAIDMGIARDSFAINTPIEPSQNNWQNHVRGVVHTLARRGHQIRPLRIAIAGDVPIGAGLASSAAFGVAVALTCSEYSGLNLAPETLAQIAQAAEQEFIGISGEITDQMAAAASTAGHALLLDCRSLQHMPIPIHRSLAITVIDTGLRRDLTGGGAQEHLAQCAAAAHHYGVKTLRDLDLAMLERGQAGLDAAQVACARHIVTEIGRVEPLAVALAQGDTAALADVMAESHRSLATDFAVSLPPIDRLVGLVAEGLGRSGGVRLMGAGFGGSLIALADRAAGPAIDDAVARYNASAEWPARAESFVASNGAAPISIR